MKLSAAAIGLMASLIASQLHAQEAYTRVFLCNNDDAKMEIYVPESALRDSALKDGRPVLAWYALDLSDPDLNKGKSLEAVLVRYAQDGLTMQDSNDFLRGSSRDKHTKPVFS